MTAEKKVKRNWGFIYTNADNKELEWYQPGNIEFEKGLLGLRASKRVVQASDGKTYNYLSGMVTTRSLSEGKPEKTRFAFECGYLEIRP